MHQTIKKRTNAASYSQKQRYAHNCCVWQVGSGALELVYKHIITAGELQLAPKLEKRYETNKFELNQRHKLSLYLNTYLPSESSKRR